MGATVCRLHGGAAPQVARKAALRAALSDWGLAAPDRDPAEVLLAVISATAARVARYGEELARLEAEHGLHGAVVTAGHFVDSYGVKHEVSEQIRSLARLEHDERKALAGFCASAISCGLEARRVRLAEQQGLQIAQVLAAVRAHPSLALTAEQRAAFAGVVREVLGLTVTDRPAIEA